MGSWKKGVRKWIGKIMALFTAMATIFAVEAVGLGQITASALTATTERAAIIWWTIGGAVIAFLTTLEIFHRRETK